MSHKDFLLLKQWLINVECVVFYLEHPILGRPGDNQFNFLDARLQGDVVILTFSSDLVMEIVDSSNLEFLKSYVELESIKILRVKWRDNQVVLNGTSLRIDS